METMEEYKWKLQGNSYHAASPKANSKQLFSLIYKCMNKIVEQKKVFHHFDTT